MKLRRIYILAISLGLCIILIMAFIVSNLKHNAKRRRRQLQEFALLAEKYQTIKRRVSAIDDWITTEFAGTSQAIENIVSDMGLNAKLESIKILERKTSGALIREDAQVSFTKLDMNETVNLLYSIENASYPLTIKKAEIKTAFEGPELLEIKLIISSFQKK